MWLRDKRAIRRLVTDPALAAGELYMDGSLSVEDGRVYDLLDVLTANLHGNRRSRPVLRLEDGMSALLRRLAQYNPAGRAQRNVAHQSNCGRRGPTRRPKAWPTACGSS